MFVDGSRVRATGIVGADGARLGLTTRRRLSPHITVLLDRSAIPGTAIEVTGELHLDGSASGAQNAHGRISVEEMRAIELPTLADWRSLDADSETSWEPLDARAALDALHALEIDDPLATGGHEAEGRMALHIDVVCVSEPLARWFDSLPAGMVDLRAAVEPL